MSPSKNAVHTLFKNGHGHQKWPAVIYGPEGRAGRIYAAVYAFEICCYFFFPPNLFSASTKWAAKAILYTVNNGFMFFKWVFGHVIGFGNGTTVRCLIWCMVLRRGTLIYYHHFICIEE